jgi:hypothetical protein
VRGLDFNVADPVEAGEVHTLKLAAFQYRLVTVTGRR